MEVELRVAQIAPGGDGIAREESGRVVFVRGAVPGEIVRAAIRHEARDFAKADVVEVLEASPTRIVPACPHVAAGCGGCGWQHIAADSQLDLKVAIVRDALARQGRLPDAVVGAGGAVPALGYRTTLRMAVQRDGRLGWHSAASHRVVTVDSCPVAHTRLAELIPEVRVSGCDEITLRIGVASGERLAWAGGARAHVEGLPRDVATDDRAAVHEDVAGHRFRVSARSFFQSSPQAAELLVNAVGAAAGAEEAASRVVDLYSGVGLFAATVAQDAEVICVERAGSSVHDARRNLRGRAATIVECDVERWDPVEADLVIADPARSGLDKGGVAVTTATSAPVIVLVSCDAAALGRDARLLSAEGYRHAWSTVLDVFPMTPHVEVVSRFERVVS